MEGWQLQQMWNQGCIRARGGGQSLADTIKKPMEQAFGADFSGVRVHTDSQADQLNQSIQAKAFTTRQDVFFRQGAYEPGSRGGQELIAHEQTHVIQHKGEQDITPQPESSGWKQKNNKDIKREYNQPQNPSDNIRSKGNQ